MCRSLIAFAVTSVVLIVAGTVPAAPVPNHLMKTGPVYYFPTTAGSKWVYVEPDGDEQVIETIKVEKVGEDLIFSRKGDYMPGDKVVVSVEGLRYVRDVGGRTMGGVMMKAKFRPGESWRLDDGTERTISGPEEVEVPAGKFNAIKVLATDCNHIIWYAPGIGEVKRVAVINGKEVVQRSLKSFVPGK